MKNLNEYLTASAKQYEYRVKIAGELPKENYEKFKSALDMFDVETCTAPKKTPIQENPVDFPNHKNEEVNIFDVTLNYPANGEQLTQLARLAGILPANIIVIGKEFDDSMQEEREGAEEGVRLETPDYPAQTKEQKEASDAYADSYETAAREFAGEVNTDFEIAGGKTPPAKYTTDEAEGKDSPMSKVKRQKLKDIMK